MHDLFYKYSTFAIMEQSVIKYSQIRIKPSNLSYKIHQTTTLTIKSPNTIPNSFKNAKLTIPIKHNNSPSTSIAPKDVFNLWLQ